MKVLQFTTWYSPRAGGVETHVKRLSEELRRLRWEVEIFTLTDTREPYTRSFPSFQIPGIPYGFGLFPHPKAFAEALITVADIVHCHGYGSAHIGATAKDISNVVTDAASGVVDMFHGSDKAVADTWNNFWKDGKADGIGSNLSRK